MLWRKRVICLLTRQFVLMKELHLKLLSGALGQKVWGGVGGIPCGTHHIGPTEHQAHCSQHIRQHHSRTQSLDTQKMALMNLYHAFNTRPK